jgi:hypothetical protein
VETVSGRREILGGGFRAKALKKTFNRSNQRQQREERNARRQEELSRENFAKHVIFRDGLAEGRGLSEGF